MTDDRRQCCEILLREHRAILFKVAAVYAHDAEDRRDLAQDIALQVWRSFASYDASRPFSTWMYRVALNVGLSHARRRGERTQPLDEALVDTLGGGTPIDEPDERVAWLMRAIGALPPLDRALVMLHLDELSYAEIASVLGIAESNVGTRLNRIRQRWRHTWNSTN